MSRLTIRYVVYVVQGTDIPIAKFGTLVLRLHVRTEEEGRRGFVKSCSGGLLVVHVFTWNVVGEKG